MATLNPDSQLLVQDSGKNYRISHENLKLSIVSIASVDDAGIVKPGPNMSYNALTGEMDPKSVLSAINFKGSIGNTDDDVIAPVTPIEVGDYYVVAEDITLGNDAEDGSVNWGNIAGEAVIQGTTILCDNVSEGLYVWRLIENGLGGGGVTSISVDDNSPLIINNDSPQTPVISIRKAVKSSVIGAGDGVDGYITADDLHSFVQAASRAEINEGAIQQLSQDLEEKIAEEDEKIEEVDAKGSALTAEDGRITLLESTSSNTVNRINAFDSEFTVINRELEVIQAEISSALDIQEQGEWLYQSEIVVAEELPEPGTGHFYIIDENGEKPDQWNEAVSIILSYTDVGGKEHTFTQWKEGDSIEVIAEASQLYSTTSYGLYRLGAKVQDAANHFEVTPIRSKGIPEESADRRHFITIYPVNEAGGDLTVSVADERYLKVTGDGNKMIEGHPQAAAPEAEDDLTNKKYVDDNFIAKTGGTIAGSDGFYVYTEDSKNRFYVSKTSGAVGLGTSSEPFMASSVQHAISKQYFDTHSNGVVNISLAKGKQLKFTGTSVNHIMRSDGDTLKIEVGGAKNFEVRGRISTPYIKVNGSSNNITIYGLANPTHDLHATNRKYVNDQINSHVGKVATVSQSGYIYQTGGYLYYKP